MPRVSCGPAVGLAFSLALTSGVCAQPTTVAANGARSGKEPGQCEVGREWSEARLRGYWDTEKDRKVRGALAYMGEPGPGYEADIAEARTQVDRILRVSGLEMNFEMVVNASTPAAAEIINGQRVILFDPRFMAQVADRICQDWGAMSILAHEVGHHLAGHTLRQSTNPWRDELEADEFSGFVLARLGATLAETTSAGARILPEQATPTHPSRKDRIAAIVHGWQNAQAMVAAEMTQAQHNRSMRPMAQKRYVETVPDGASDLAMVARIILYDDPNDFYITRGGRIESFDGQRRPVGKKAVSLSSAFAWTFEAGTGSLQVDFAGRVYMTMPSGTLHEVGMVLDLMPSKDGAP